MHFYPVAPELVPNRRRPSRLRGAHTIRLDVVRRAAEERRSRRS
jgi:hypothetical protein